MRRMIVVLLVITLAACGGKHTDERTNQTPPPEHLVPAATLSPVLGDLQQDFEALRGSQQAINQIWDQLAANQGVQCGNYPDVLSPEAISAAGDPAYQPLADLLRSAANELNHALSVWKAECANPRQMPPPDVIDEGRLGRIFLGSGCIDQSITKSKRLAQVVIFCKKSRYLMIPNQCDTKNLSGTLF